jgi:hypothetical protein
VTVLSSHEQQLWNDIERFYAAKAEEPAPPEPRRPTRIAGRRGSLQRLVEGRRRRLRRAAR